MSQVNSLTAGTNWVTITIGGNDAGFSNVITQCALPSWSANAIPPFTGHAVCSSTEWVNGLSNPIGESYHPNRTGHSSGYTPLVRDIMG